MAWKWWQSSKSLVGATGLLNSFKNYMQHGGNKLGLASKIIIDLSDTKLYKPQQKQEMLKLPQHKLIQKCVTHGGSTLGVLQRLTASHCSSADERKGDTFNVWGTIIEELMEILYMHMSVEKYPAVSIIKPLLYL